MLPSKRLLLKAILILGIVSLNLNAKTSPLCIRLLLDHNLGLDAHTISETIHKIDTLSGETNPYAILSTLNSWLGMYKTRPDLVIAGMIKLIDAVQNNLIDTEDGVTLLAKNFNSIILSLSANDTSFAHLHYSFLKFLLTNMSDETFNLISNSFLELSSKKGSSTRNALLERVEQSLLCYGTLHNYDQNYFHPHPKKRKASIQWHKLKEHFQPDATEPIQRRQNTSFLAAPTFYSQLLAFLKVSEEHTNHAHFLELLEENPFENEDLSARIQRRLELLIKSDKEFQATPFKQGFATQLALDNIHRTFELLAKDESPEAFLLLFSNFKKIKENDLSYFSSLTERYYSFWALSFLWEKLILWNLESTNEWRASEQSLIEQAQKAPYFILRLVSLRTTNTKLKSFLSKIQIKKAASE